MLAALGVVSHHRTAVSLRTQIGQFGVVCVLAAAAAVKLWQHCRLLGPSGSGGCPAWSRPVGGLVKAARWPVTVVP